MLGHDLEQALAGRGYRAVRQGVPRDEPVLCDLGIGLREALAFPGADDEEGDVVVREKCGG